MNLQGAQTTVRDGETAAPRAGSPNIRLSCGWDAGRGAGTDLPIKRVIAGWPPR
jgi:hypothetical protein